MLIRIFNYVEEFDKGLKHLINDFSIMTQTVASHSMSIEQLENQICHTSIHLNPRQKGTLLSKTILNPKN